MYPKGGTIVENEIDQLTNLFGLLADKTRVNILMVLVAGERNVTSLCEQLALPQPTVSHHLGLLRVNNVIANRRRGKQVFYALNTAVKASDGQSLEIAIENFSVRIARSST